MTSRSRSFRPEPKQVRRELLPHLPRPLRIGTPSDAVLTRPAAGPIKSDACLRHETTNASNGCCDPQGHYSTCPTRLNAFALGSIPSSSMNSLFQTVPPASSYAFEAGGSTAPKAKERPHSIRSLCHRMEVIPNKRGGRLASGLHPMPGGASLVRACGRFSIPRPSQTILGTWLASRSSP